MAEHRAEMTEPDELFGEVISRYSREQALRDGALVDVSEMAAEAGFVLPTAMTAAAWADLVAWGKDSGPMLQDEAGRLWDVLYLGMLAARKEREQSEVRYEVFRVPSGELSTVAEPVQVVVHCGPGDEREPVLTIMLDTER